MQFNLQRWALIMTALVAVAVPAPFVLIPVDAAQMEVPKMTAAEIEQRGKQLRAEVDRIYAEKAAAHALKPMGVRRNFITDEVIKYIPLGISFDDAEAILRAAGCVVSPHPENKHPGPLSYRDVVLAKLVLKSGFPSVTAFVVHLTPRSVGDYSTVDKLTAEIAINYV